MKERKTVIVTVPTDVHRRLKVEAAARGVTMQNLLMAGLQCVPGLQCFDFEEVLRHDRKQRLG